MIKTTYFYFSILQLFKSAIFFSLLQLFTACEHLKLARDSTSNWHILMPCSAVGVHQERE